MASSNSTIRFSLKANRLYGRDTSPYTAQVRSYKTIGREEMIADMADMNASVSRQEIIVVLDLMKAVIRKYLLAGFCVKTDLFNARVSMTGGFGSIEDEYDPARHTVRVRMAPAADLKKSVVSAARMEKIRATEPAPELDRVYDYETQSDNSAVSPGYKAEVVHKLNGSHVVFKVPSLTPGTYNVIVRRGFGSEIREGKLKALISVN